MKPQTDRQKLLLFEAIPENLQGKTCGKCANCYRHRWDLSYFYCNARPSNRTGNGSLKVKHRQQACHLFKEKTKAIANGEMSMKIITVNNEEFIEGFTQDGGITPIDIVSEITGLTCDEIKSLCYKNGQAADQTK